MLQFGFLAFNDIQSDYYQIPHDDKEKLKKEEENLRIELKEKNKHVEEVNKSGEGNADLISANENINILLSKSINSGNVIIYNNLGAIIKLQKFDGSNININSSKFFRWINKKDSPPRVIRLISRVLASKAF